ncbi:hypothetical protein [Carbonactinospora thermoautotrophica]|uniref:hypothetical protein n=1 Tax=Carbonactinospora thermoautotrophica TaxID=1469144 RepID=UPI003DAA15F3
MDRLSGAYPDRQRAVTRLVGGHAGGGLPGCGLGALTEHAEGFCGEVGEVGGDAPQAALCHDREPVAEPSADLVEVGEQRAEPGEWGQLVEAPLVAGNQRLQPVEDVGWDAGPGGGVEQLLPSLFDRHQVAGRQGDPGGDGQLAEQFTAAHVV